VIAIICCGNIYLASGAGKIFALVLKTHAAIIRLFRQDFKDCVTKIWISIKQGLLQVFGSMNIVKLLEPLVIGTFIICVPEIMNFVIKILIKLGTL